MFNDFYWNPYRSDRQQKRFQKWFKTSMRDLEGPEEGEKGARTLAVFELGVSGESPGLRKFSEGLLKHSSVSLIRIEAKSAFAPF